MVAKRIPEALRIRHASEKLYRITLAYACFGVLVLDKRVLLAPPIAAWTIGKEWFYVRCWYEKKRVCIIEQIY